MFQWLVLFGSCSQAVKHLISLSSKAISFSKVSSLHAFLTDMRGIQMRPADKSKFAVVQSFERHGLRHYKTWQCTYHIGSFTKGGNVISIGKYNLILSSLYPAAHRQATYNAPTAIYRATIPSVVRLSSTMSVLLQLLKVPAAAAQSKKQKRLS